MERTKVESSQITSIGYDAKVKVLEVEFSADSSVYQYKNVDSATYTALIAADSVGAYFTKTIKRNPAKYPYTKVTESAPEKQCTHSFTIRRRDGAVCDKCGHVEFGREIDRPKSSIPVDVYMPVAVLATERVVSTALTMPAKARAITIANNDEYITAADFLKGVKSLRAEVDAAFDPIITKAHETHKVVLEQKRKAEAPLIEAEKIVKASVSGYLSAKEQERVAEEYRIRKAHEDRIRAQADEENLKRAQELAAVGDMDGAAAAVDAEVSIPEIPVQVESTVPKIAGIGKRVLYVIADVDLMMLVKAVADGTAPLECVRANDVFLNAQARAYKKAGVLFPGVRVGTEDNIAAGRL